MGLISGSGCHILYMPYSKFMASRSQEDNGVEQPVASITTDQQSGFFWWGKEELYEGGDMLAPLLENLTWLPYFCICSVVGANLRRPIASAFF